MDNPVTVCPNCSATVHGATCDYCGAFFPQNVPVATTVIVNNYYGDTSAADPNAQPKYDYDYEQQPSQSQPQVIWTESVYPPVSPKSRLVTFLLAFFLGVFGVHRFYVGRPGLGLLFLFTLGLFGIGWFIDIVFALAGVMRDGNDLVVADWNV